MSLNVVSNYAANVAQRYLQKADAEATRSVAKLAAGTRVLSARDDAASMAVGMSLRADVIGLKQAAVNVGQAASMIQIADGAMSTVGDILLRMKSLATQGASDQLDTTQRAMLDTEFTALIDEVDRIAKVTNFDGKVLTSGTFASTGLQFQVGHANTANDSIEVDIADISKSALSIGANSVTALSAATTAIDAINTAIDTVATARASLGASQNRLEFAGANIATQMENAEAARSTLMDLDVAAEMSAFTSNQILQQAGVSMLAQANQMPQNLLRLFR
ncbi:flagellin [Hyphomonas sp.]|jgi:flagellin|uniref:flagellin n=2 Tax=Hyphomonas sp. TaxID=87 RepID=UPI0037BF019B